MQKQNQRVTDGSRKQTKRSSVMSCVTYPMMSSCLIGPSSSLRLDWRRGTANQTPGPDGGSVGSVQSEIFMLEMKNFISTRIYIYNNQIKFLVCENIFYINSKLN